MIFWKFKLNCILQQQVCVCMNSIVSISIHDGLHSSVLFVTLWPTVLVLNTFCGWQKLNQYCMEVPGLVACFPISTEYIWLEIINLRVSSELISESAKPNIALLDIGGLASTSIGITYWWHWHCLQVSLKPQHIWQGILWIQCESGWPRYFFLAFNEAAQHCCKKYCCCHSWRQ